MKKSDKLEVLRKALNRVSAKDEMNGVIDTAVEMISAGYSRESIVKKISHDTDCPAELYEFARSRVSVRKKFSRWNRLWLDSYSCSYSTPEYVGNYRSARLKGSKLIDLGSGAGMQAIMFSLNSDVTAVEKNEARVLMAQLNVIEYGRNMDIFNTDVFSFLESGKVGMDAVVFSDPLRTRNSEGNISLSPEPSLIKEKLEKVTKRFVFDLPPRTPVSDVSPDSEAEYMSSEGSLVRLTEYSAKLAESQSSAVIFPSGTIYRGERRDAEFQQGENPRYLAIPDVALVASGLSHLAGEYGEFFRCDQDRRRLILGSRREPERGFPGDVYNVVGSGTMGQIKDMIKKDKPSKLYLRYSLEPGTYYTKVNELNPSPGSGDPLYVFHLQNGYILCSRII